MTESHCDIDYQDLREDMGQIKGIRVLFFCNKKNIQDALQEPSRNPTIIAIDNKIGSSTRGEIRQEIEQLFEDTQKKSPLWVEYPNPLPTIEETEGTPEIWLVAAYGQMEEMQNWIRNVLQETS